MAKEGTAVAEAGTPNIELVSGANQPRSLGIAQAGVRTGADFANLMSALMADIITGAVEPQVANAACNAGGRLLKIVEMSYKYGKQPQDRVLVLAPGMQQSEADITTETKPN